MNVLLWIFLLSSGSLASRKLKTVYEWKYIDYVWTSEDQRQTFIRNGEYDSSAPIPIDVDLAPDGRVFITTIKNIGVPASLTTISNITGPSGPLLSPYPNWSWYQKNSCGGDRITNVYRIAIDECNRLWVLDNGHIGNDLICPAQLLTFDLKNDRLLQRVEIQNSVQQNRNGVGKLVTPVIETEGQLCNNTTVYMADPNGNGLVIWKGGTISIRLESHIFNGIPSAANISIAGENFTLNDGLLGIALTPQLFPDEPRLLVFRPMASYGLYGAQTRVLTRSFNAEKIKYYGSDNVLPSQAIAQGMSSEGTLFFGLTKEIAIGCWNRYKDLETNIDIAVTDKDRLQFASGLKIIPPERTKTTEEMWTLTNRLQKTMTNTRNFDEINFRVLKGSVSELISGTKCEIPDAVKMKVNYKEANMQDLEDKPPVFA